jgi:hypothetical protein
MEILVAFVVILSGVFFGLLAGDRTFRRHFGLTVFFSTLCFAGIFAVFYGAHLIGVY